jgi:hypothetical protein
MPQARRQGLAAHGAEDRVRVCTAHGRIVAALYQPQGSGINPLARKIPRVLFDALFLFSRLDSAESVF